MEFLVIILAIIIGLSFVALFVGLSAIINGWVLTKLWLWFVVPFFGVHPLSIAYAIGLSLIIGLLTLDYSSMDNAKKADKTKADNVILIITPFISPLIVLLMGFIVHLFL